jgi:hypothetical protein
VFGALSGRGVLCALLRWGVQNGYLNPNHLKQLAIHKGVFASVVKPTRMALIKALTPQAIFAEERKQKAAAAADDDDDDDDDEDEEDGEEEN